MSGQTETPGVTILYEDNHVICAVKPRGLLSQADETGAPDMLTVLKRYIKEKYGKPGEAYLGLVHRLDRPAGGVMVFARTSKAAGRLSAQMRGRDVQKTYFAVVRGEPPDATGRLEHTITKDRLTNTVRVSSVTQHNAAAGGGMNAVLEYITLEAVTVDHTGARRSGGGAGDIMMSLVRVNLLTGRPHQIRAQFAHIGNPIVGDRKYGTGYAPAGRATAEAQWPASRATGAEAKWLVNRAADTEAERPASRVTGAEAKWLVNRAVVAEAQWRASRVAGADAQWPASRAVIAEAEWPALWAASIEFEHPVTHRRIAVSAPPPGDYPWSAFGAELMQLQN